MNKANETILDINKGSVEAKFQLISSDPTIVFKALDMQPANIFSGTLIYMKEKTNVTTVDL